MKVSLSFALLLEAVASSQGDKGSGASRRLSYESLGSYEPYSLVTDHAAIDWDLHYIKKLLGVGTQASYTQARRIYQEGAHSKSVAELRLSQPLTEKIDKGAVVVGSGIDQSFYSLVKGTVMEDTWEEDNLLKVQYDVNEVQESYVGCQVGAHPEPNVDGCFVGDGILHFPELDKYYNYTYDIYSGNLNFRTIQGFSTTAREKMYECSHCPYAEYKKYVDYYGRFEYADHMVDTAFKMERTDTLNGNQDFSIYSYRDNKGLTEIIEKAMLYMNIWMYVVRELEDAIDDCVDGCDEALCNDDVGVHAWDEAVAFYAGSRTTSDDDDGNLLYALANKRCPQAKTCGPEGNEEEGTAWVNYEIMRQFKKGQSEILNKECETARATKDRIVSLMKVPLIQGMLRYAHIMAGENYTQKHSAQGVVFSMAVLPLVHACSPKDAETIYNNLRSRKWPTVFFADVKAAVERNYECMGINGEEVSGIWDSVNQDFMADALPFNPSDYKGINDQSKTVAVAVSVSLLVVVAISFLVYCRRRRATGKESDTGERFEGSETTEEIQVEGMGLPEPEEDA